jgi:DNA-binding response OmpR family regulator
MAKRILVVDDEHVISNTLAMIFRHAGYEATGYKTGSEALEYAKSSPPDLALIDDLLPGPPDGAFIAMELSRLVPGCEILLMSGMNDATKLVSKAAEQGFDFELLAKPIPPSELLEKVKSKLTVSRRAHSAAG